MIKLFGWLLLLLFFCPLHAQINLHTKYLELGITATATNYSGDLVEKHILLAHTRTGGGAFARYHLNRFILLRGQFFAGWLFSDDKNSPRLAGRHFRQSTRVLEGAALLEGNLISFKIDAISSNTSYYFFTYLFAGIAAVGSTPRVTYYGPPNRYDRFVLTPIPERGQKNHVMLVTPFGMGVRMIAGDRVSLGVEAGVRPTYADVLDGVSLNANPKKNDWYYTAGVTASYFIGEPWRPARAYF